MGEEGKGCGGFLSTAERPGLEGLLACGCWGVQGTGDGVKKQTRRLQGLGLGGGRRVPEHIQTGQWDLGPRTTHGTLGAGGAL